MHMQSSGTMLTTGQGGSTTTRNKARKLLHSCWCETVVSSINIPEKRKLACGIGNMLYLILRVVSSSRRVDLDNYTTLCTGLYFFLITKLPWVSIMPSLHKLLAYSAKLIQANDGCGLEAFSEEGMEANNKRLRQIQTELS